MLFYILAGLGAGGTVVTPVLMVRSFPPEVRYNGVSFSYNLPYAIFGGLTPIAVTWLVHLSPLGAPHYVAFVTMLALLRGFAAWRER